MKEFKNLTEVIAYFSSEDKCRDTVEKMRWPDGNIICPKCGKERLWGHYEKPDLFIYEIKDDLKGDKIYSIENLMLYNGLEAQKGENIFSFGYPTIEFKKNVKNYLNTQPSLLKMTLLKNPNEAYLMKDGNNMSTYYYTSNPNLEQGRSGSPVFFKSPINSRMYFLGILAAGDSTKKESYIVKYRELINELKNVK